MSNKLFNLGTTHISRINWVEWLESRKRKHIYSWRDDVVDIAEELIKEIWFIHNIRFVLFLYTDKTLHIELRLPDGNYYGMVPFDTIDIECKLLSELKSEERTQRIKERLKYLLLDSFGRR